MSFAAIRTVARGHEMVAQGWAAFERTCTEVGVGELPQLLQYVKTHTTPTPTATPVKEEEEEPMDVGVKKEEAIVEKPIHVSFGGQTVEYRCGNCDVAPKKSKSGMDAHIRSVHKKKALLCSSVRFYVQFRFFEQAHEGAQLEPSFCHLWVMSQLPHPWGFNHFIFFKAHFLSVNVFQGEGGIVCYWTVVNQGDGIAFNELLYIRWGGIKDVHGGWDMGG